MNIERIHREDTRKRVKDRKMKESCSARAYAREVMGTHEPHGYLRVASGCGLLLLLQHVHHVLLCHGRLLLLHELLLLEHAHHPVHAALHPHALLVSTAPLLLLLAQAIEDARHRL
jgi:hypothetical protein